MARVNYGAIVQNISGSVNGHTFQKNAYGFSLRAKPISCKTCSPIQAAMRNYMSIVQAAWAGMSDADKSLWDNFSAYHYSGAVNNRGSVLSGYNLFVKYNLLRRLIYSDTLTTFSYWSSSPSSNNPQIKRSGATLLFNPNNTVNDTGLTIGLFLSYITRKTNSFDPSAIRYIWLKSYANSWEDITSHYLAVFGALPIAGDIIQLKLIILNLYSPVIFQPSGKPITVIS